MRIITELVKKNVVLTVAFAAAVITALFVPPDSLYLGYLDWHTLLSLFSVLAVVTALRNIRFFFTLARQMVTHFKTARSAILAVVYITFIGSMLITNDMALLIFLPLSYLVLSATGKERYLLFTFIMQNTAANLGGMLTPFGNPQNLYLYSFFNIPTTEFMAILLFPFLTSLLLITLACLLVKPEPLAMAAESAALPRGRVALYLGMFILCLGMVLRFVPLFPGAAVIALILLVADRSALKKVDYPLLLTFACFFVFAGNMARIEPIRELFSALLERSVLLTSVVASQFISNVPAAILLAQFTGNYRDLLIGVNIGGAGTLVASLAGLITYYEYKRLRPGKGREFMIMFTVISFAFLLILVGLELIFR